MKVRPFPRRAEMLVFHPMQIWRTGGAVVPVPALTLPEMTAGFDSSVSTSTASVELTARPGAIIAAPQMAV
jgi:hypothetical protein